MPDEQLGAHQSAAMPDPTPDSREPQYLDPESPRSEGEEDACPICLEPQTEAGAVLTTSCGHRFCASCLRAATSRSAACPLCRGRAHACLQKNRAACALCRADIPSIKEAMMMDYAASARVNLYARCTNVWVALITILSVMFLVYVSCHEIVSWLGISSTASAGRLDTLYSVPLWAIACIFIVISVLNIFNGAMCAHHLYVRGERPAYTAALSQAARRVAPAPVPEVRPEVAVSVHIPQVPLVVTPQLTTHM